MSKRLQVLIDPLEYATYRKQAKIQGLSVGEWVRRSLKQVLSASPEHPQKTNQKIKKIRQFSAYKFPTADIEDMLAEIEKGYLS